MHGFFGSYGQVFKWDLTAFNSKSFVARQHNMQSLHVEQITLPKFLNDKYFLEEDDCFIATEGVLFEADSATEAIRRYRQGETCFWKSWRGSFCGLLYDSRTDTLLVFNDHIGSKMLFYAQTENAFVFASDLQAINRAIGPTADYSHFAQAIIDSGCTNDNSTFVSNIHRLTAGQYLCVHGTDLRITEYHRFDNTPYPYDETTMVAQADRLFRQAVERVIRKNEQEGLQHFFPLSGGLDSRMCQWIAHETASQPITNYTYSQSNHYDHLIPKEISTFLGNKWLFCPLDGGRYITDVDGVCARTEWLVNYMGPIEIDYFARHQDWQQVGVVLTGVNGDNIFATETDNAHEMARIYTQGFNGNSLGSPLVLQHYTESYSPFCDVDVLNYVLHIPTVKRRNYYFYDRWILTCYPEAAQWHHKHVQIGHRPAMVTVAGRNIPVRNIPARIAGFVLRRLHICETNREAKGVSMTPYDDWIKENPQILTELYSYYSSHKHLLSNTALLTACEEKMRIGSIMDKGRVLTILSAIQHLCATDTDNG